MHTKVLTAHVPLPLADQIDKFAHQLERSRGWVIKQALTNWVAEAEEHHQLTLEALNDVDTRQLIPHHDIQAWANSLTSDNPLKQPATPFK
ncbi:CopG family ribbon-helix-helix protein [Methylotenera sp.]|uniref:CopG family ribbon-helix-helix protein n=1 Tax=Methylotenera sp. TaxID=2051956 RepID=UPI00272F9B16|nr:ribbon-helix-helix domain-containing protein [Methylotenera sp.]MDP2230717.1 ribbon-helix-helix domain-containing protein [Methylotenera sp.]